MLHVIEILVRPAGRVELVAPVLTTFDRPLEARVDFRQRVNRHERPLCTEFGMNGPG
jgi:hypothetical protein